MSKTSASLPLLAALSLLIPTLIFAIPGVRASLASKLRQFSGRRKALSTSEIASLRIYPIKSCRGIEVSKASLRSTGLDLDRQWMLVDAHTHEFLTIRQIPELTLVNTALSDDGETLMISIAGSHGNSTAVRIPSHPTPDWLAHHTTFAADIKIWSHLTDAYCYGPEVNGLFSTFLHRDVCLAYKGPSPRALGGNGAAHLLGRPQTTNFPDVHPALIASEASITELNSRLRARGADPISIERFRPNIIVKGNAPWAEDAWKLVRISPAAAQEPSASSSSDAHLDFDVLARCARCQVPNVDPDSAVKHPSEPWNTLMSYRRVDEGIKWKPCFGMLSAPRNEGELRVGMRFEVLEETDQHRYILGF